MKNELEILDQIQRVKTPPFLYTRIESKINEVEVPEISIWRLASLCFVLLILVFVNIGSSEIQLVSDNKTEQIISEISSSNQFYHE